MILVMLAGGIGTSAFFSYSTCPVEASIKIADWAEDSNWAKAFT